jgi:ATP-binding cassette subfamily F protein 3
MAGIQEPAAGTVVRSTDLKIGYLPQQMTHARNKSVLEEALTVFAAVENLRRETERITKELSRREDYDSNEYKKLMVDLTEATDRLHILSSDNPRGNAEKTLVGLGFKAGELDRSTRTFSEGWNMRIELAKLLLSRPDVTFA